MLALPCLLPVYSCERETGHPNRWSLHAPPYNPHSTIALVRVPDFTLVVVFIINISVVQC